VCREDFIIETHLEHTSLDIVVGIPSHNEADNIHFVVRQVAQGLNQYFSHLDTAIVNADNDSEDGTKEIFLQTETGKIPKVYLSTPPGVKGKGSNFNNLFKYLSRYRPKTVIVVDADLRSIQPEWIRGFGRTVLKGYDFVAPLYSRNEYDGTITNHLCYPLLYGVFGHDIRQPIGGDFAFSGKLMEHWMTRNWGRNVLQYGIDIFMTSEAILSGFSTAQLKLGYKVHNPSAPKLGEMFPQVMDTLFQQLLGSRDLWKLNGERPQTPPIFNGCNGLTERPRLRIDYKALKEQALEEFSARKGLILEILPEKLGGRIETMFEAQILRVKAPTWTEVVYSFLRAYASASDSHKQLKIVQALRPLYLARVVFFIRDTLELDHVACEEKLVEQAETFWLNRRKLLAAFPIPAPRHQRNDPSPQRSTRSISEEDHAFRVS
jgi:glycosyltransferase involved in cell wall biosynthesis